MMLAQRQSLRILFKTTSIDLLVNEGIPRAPELANLFFARALQTILFILFITLTAFLPPEEEMVHP